MKEDDLSYLTPPGSTACHVDFAILPEGQTFTAAIDEV